MAENGLYVGLDMLVDADAGTGFGQQRGQCGLTHLKRLAAQIVAVQFEQVKGIKDDVPITAARVQLVE